VDTPQTKPLAVTPGSTPNNSAGGTSNQTNKSGRTPQKRHPSHYKDESQRTRQREETRPRRSKCTGQ